MAKFLKSPYGAKIALFLLLLGCVGIDQATKYFAHKDLLIWEDTQNTKAYTGALIPLLTLGDEAHSYVAFQLNYVRNVGAAWGMLSNLNDSVRDPFFFLITLIAIVVIGFYFRATPQDHKLARLGLTLVLSGAIGNFLDRMIHGYVIDFIGVSWKIPLPFHIAGLDFWQYDFPRFNGADSCITFGITCLLIDMIFFEPKRGKTQTLSFTN